MRLTVKFLIASFLIFAEDANCLPTRKEIPNRNTNVCKSSCDSLLDGRYQSCHGCHVFAECIGGKLHDNRPCTHGHVWDDEAKSCQSRSTTCTAGDVIFSSMKDTKVLHPDHDMPDNVRLEFAVGSSKVALNLSRNANVDPAIPLFVQESGQVQEREMGGAQDYALYYDTTRQASFIVRKKEGSTTEHEYEGLFRHGRKDYFIQPTPKSGRGAGNAGRSRRSADPDEGDALPYMVTQVLPANIDIDTANTTMRPELKQMAEKQEETLLAAQDLGALPNRKQHYVVESFVFLDYAIYQKWYSMSKQRTHEARDQEALQHIKFYFSHVMNGVDMRYRSINDPTFSISVKVTGMFVARRREEAHWTENNVRDQYYTDAYDSLDDFEDWLNITKNTFPPFDQATLFSGYDLYTHVRDDGTLRTIAGLADIRAACLYTDFPRFYSASINHDNGLYASTQTAAHEMGHNVGAYHDGNDFYAPSCSGSDQYIMASSPGVLTNSTFNNTFTFSQCSIDMFRHYIMGLTMSDNNCLLDSHDFSGLDRNLLRTTPGQTYDPDVQCHVMYGPQSYYCGSGARDATICTRMFCYVPDLDRCYAHGEQRAFDGTSCGNKKWCHAGRCVSNSSAPETAESCIYGDYRGYFEPGHLKCASLIYQQPWMCYGKSGELDCCDSCQQIRDDTKPGCEYGDHDQYCVNIRPTDCYSANTAARCCTTCARIRRNITGCEYGDRASWCNTLSPYQCYNQDDTCCEACRRFVNTANSPDCKYGDKVSWCHRLTKRDCYNTYNLDRCCNFCQRQRSERADCPFGDRSQYCTAEDCLDSSNWGRCCETCRYHIPTTPTTTTTSTTTTSTPTITTSTTTTPTTTTPTTTTSTTTTPTTTTSTTTPPTTTTSTPTTTTSTTTTPTTTTSTTTTPTTTTSTPTTTTSATTTPTTTTSTTTTPTTTTSTTMTPTTATSTTTTPTTTTTVAETTTTTSQTTTTRSSAAPTTTKTEPTTTSPSVTTSIPTTTNQPGTESLGCSGGDKADYCSSLLPNACYFYNRTCCDKCTPHYNSQHPGCEFGDKAEWCPNYVTGPEKCEGDPFVADTCCFSCSVDKSCRDSADWCPTYVVEPTICDTNAHVSNICCKTCALVKNSAPADPCSSSPCVHGTCSSTPDSHFRCDCDEDYTGETCDEELVKCDGDSATWCATMHPSHCYNEQTRDTCCQTCGQIRHEKASVGLNSECRYGDRYSWCKPLYCSTQSDACCESCNSQK